MLKFLSKLFQSNNTENETGFGTLKGVFIPNVTMMFGVIIFLRLGTAVSYIGPTTFIAVEALAISIMIITTLSIIPIVTNMDVKGGGLYYLISRSLGVELGGALGISLYAAQLISIVLCITGFSYSLHSLLPNISIYAIELTTLSVITLMSLVSTDFALRAQGVIMIILLAAIASIFWGCEDVSENASKTLLYPNGLTFWGAFALLYPALTGIEAGMAMSGCLKTPSKSLAIGGLTSIIFVGATYIILGLTYYYLYPTETLKSYPEVVFKGSIFPPLIYLGVWAATLSSALGSLLGAPRMLQALAEDNIIPNIFAKEYGKHSEPRYSIALTFILSAILLLYTNIDAIIPILAMICLLSYGLLNLLAGTSELINASHWRPAINIPWYISFFGGITCFIVMLMINAGWAIISIVLILIIYFYIRYRKIEVDFQDLRDSILFYLSRQALYRLNKTEDGALSWHPQLLVFSGAPAVQEKMIFLSHSLTRRSGLLTISSILPMAWEEEYNIQKAKSAIEYYMNQNNLSGIAEVLAHKNSYEGIKNAIKSYGMGAIQPNTIVLGIPTEKEGLNQLLEEIYPTAAIYSKNLILFHGGSTLEKSFKQPYIKKPKKIDIWWDGNYRGNFELMLSFIHALKKDPIWKHSSITLKAAIYSDSAEKNLEDYFKEYIAKTRFKIKHRIYNEDTLETHFDIVKKHSHDADLIFLGLPEANEEDQYNFDNICDMVFKCIGDKPLVFISRLDNIDHRDIYV